jgi:hypothetical protein
MYLMLVLIVLLPIVPAFLLFKALPSKAVVTGPLQGLKINLGGAFAGYFAMVVLVLSTHSIWNPPPMYQVWEVIGSVSDDQGNPIEPFDPGDITLAPPPIETRPAGAFKISFATWPGQGGAAEYPALMIGHQNFQSQTFNLDPADDAEMGMRSRLKRDSERRIIKLPNVALKRLPAYQVNGVAVQPLRLPLAHP